MQAHAQVGNGAVAAFNRVNNSHDQWLGHIAEHQVSAVKSQMNSIQGRSAAA